MPANVETMFSAVETPWHRLGVVTDSALTSKEAIVQAGLDWTVSVRPLATFSNEGGGQTEGNFIDVPDNYATVRDSDESVLGVVGKRYEPIQNLECFSFLDNVLDDYSAKYETAGALDDGRIIWVLLNLGKNVVVGDDVTVPYLLMTNSHDGSTSIKALTTPIRVVCQNTLSLALGNYKSSFSFRHTQNVRGRIDQARNSLELSYKYIDGFQEEVERLIEQQITDEQFRGMVEAIMPITQLNDDQTNLQLVAKQQQAHEDILQKFRAPEFAEHRESAWAGLNAMSNYELWDAPVRNEEREVRIAKKTIQQNQTPNTNILHRLLIGQRYENI
tara:strand:- start:718 stop:1710 length:993 start_codon:yes stop_codon:yes gene_type:complete